MDRIKCQEENAGSRDLFSGLIQLARSNPLNSSVARALYEEYSALKRSCAADEHVTYLQLKYFHELQGCSYLNKLADLYLSQNKNFVSLLCFLESLRLNPGQTQVFDAIESLNGHFKPLYPQRLRENKRAVSVIMATYNRTEGIRDAIQSVLNQTFQDFELVIINDGGTDEIKRIIDSFHSPKIKYYKLRENKGLAGALNEGILCAEGKYIAYLDDDDVYYPSHLETLVRELDQNKYKFVYTNTKALYGLVENHKFKPASIRFIWNEQFNKNNLLLENYISVLSIMHHKSIFIKIGLFREELPVAMDWDLWLRSSLQFNFLHRNKNTGEYRTRQDNMTTNNWSALLFYVRLIRSYYCFYQGKIARIKHYLANGERQKADELYQEIIGSYKKGYFKTRFSVQELIGIAGHFNDSKFIKTLFKDYLYFAPQFCLKEAADKKLTKIFFSIIPAMPRVILAKMKEKAAESHKKWIDRIRKKRHVYPMPIQNKLEKEACKEKLESGSMDFSNLAQVVQANPTSRLLASFFCEEYEKQKTQDIKSRLTYLTLKYLYDDLKWPYLNELATIYINQNNRFFAFVCLAESLRLNAGQPEIFALMESLKEHARIEFPAQLKENKCTVSIIMTTYNRADLIKEAIQSVLNQTFQDFELVIVNDAGLEEIKDVVDSFRSPKIKYYRSPQNKGYSAITNEGILMAEGKYIAYLDDDDIYYPDHLETLVRALEKSRCNVAYTNTQAINGSIEDGKFNPIARRHLWDYDFNRNSLLLHNYIAPLALMHRKDILYEVGLFNQAFFPAGDWEMYLRTALKFEFFHVNKVTGEYRNKEDNATLKNFAKLKLNVGLIRSYYTFCQGKIAYIKYYLHHNDRQKAYNLYQNIVTGYKSYFKTRFGAQELLEIAKYFNDRKFIKILVKDYLYLAPRICLQEIIKKKSMSIFSSILPLLPWVTLLKTKEKAFQCSKRLLKKIKNDRKNCFYKNIG